MNAEENILCLSTHVVVNTKLAIGLIVSFLPFLVAALTLPSLVSPGFLVKLGSVSLMSCLFHLYFFFFLFFSFNFGQKSSLHDDPLPGVSELGGTSISPPL